jgi:hypothetical protein
LIGFDIDAINRSSLISLPIDSQSLIVGGDSLPATGDWGKGIQGAAVQSKAQRITIGFDLSAEDPNSWFADLTQTTYYFTGGFYLLNPNFSPIVPLTGNAYYFMTTRASSDQFALAETQLGSNQPHDTSVGFQNSMVSFAHSKTLHVETDLWSINGVGILSYNLQFKLVNVPEPSTVSMIFIGLSHLLIALFLSGRFASISVK